MFKLPFKFSLPRPSKTILSMGLAGFLVSSSSVGVGYTLSKEGMKLKPYYDSTGVLTWCGGETEVGYKESFTEKECTDLFAIRYGYYSSRVASMYNDVAKAKVTPEVHAAATDLAYNIGLSGVKKSTFMKRLNEGKILEACSSLTDYVFAGRLSLKEQRDPNIRKHPIHPTRRYCTYREHNCFGVHLRRLETKKLCLSGV